MATAFWILIILVGLFFYFIPTFNAYGRPQFQGVIVLNILLGWTLIGWVVAFIWSFSNSSPKAEVIEQKVSSADELTKLHDLKNKGIISEEEFNSQKKKILEK